MAFKDTQTLTCLLFIWLNFIEVSSFVRFTEDKRIDSLGSFNKNARERESFDRGDDNANSAGQIGRLIIGQNQTPYYKDSGDGVSSSLGSHNPPHNDDNAYQSDDAGRVNLEQLWGQVYSLNTMYTPAVESLLGMKPKVDCVGDLMKLTVHGRDASFGSNFLIDRGRISPLPLSQLPSECGHTLLRTWRDFVFVIPYNGCYVSQERDMHILPLLWWGLPVKMSCSSSTSARSTPAVSCHTNGMIVTLQRSASMNLKVKVMNEWHPLLKASAKCGYSLVSHPESVAIHAPYMPCTEAKDGMFTLSMAAEREFNLSCPAVSLGLPMTEANRVSKNDTSSLPHSLVSLTLTPTTTASVKTAQPTVTASQTTSTSSTMPKPFPTPLPYHVPNQPFFKPVPPNYPFLLFQPNVPPTAVSPATKAVVTPPPITHGPQAPKPPQTWYPWYPKPNLVFAPDPTKSSLIPPYLREPVLPPPKPPISPFVNLLKPTNIPLQKKPTPMAPPVKWPPMYPPSRLVYPLYPAKPGSHGTSSAGSSQIPQWLHHFQTQPRPNEPSRLKPSQQHASPKPMLTPPIPAPTRKAEQIQLLHFPRYNPLPQQYLEMPSVPMKAPQVTTVSIPQPPKRSNYSVTQGLPLRLHLDFTPSTHPTRAPSKTTKEVTLTSTSMKVPKIKFNLFHAHSSHCPTFCPGPPSVSYHHHNHHHFGHLFPVPYLGTSSLTKITTEVESPPIQPPSSTSAPFPFIQGMGYNYSPYFSKVVAPPPAKQYLAPTQSPIIKSTRAPDTELVVRPTPCPYIFRTVALNSRYANNPPFTCQWESNKPPSRSIINAAVAEPLVHSFQNPNPTLYQAKVQQYVSHIPPNNVGPLSQSQHEVSLKPTMLLDQDKNLAENYWYQAASYASPAMSDAPVEMSRQALIHPPINNHNPLDQSATPLQPKQTHDVNPQLYDPQNGKPAVPIFRDSEPFGSYWVPAVQSNQKTVHSTKYPDGSMMGSVRFVLRHMEGLQQR